MNAVGQSGLDISPVITHRFQGAIDLVKFGDSGKIVIPD
jgi:hypothetical protein